MISDDGKWIQVFRLAPAAQLGARQQHLLNWIVFEMFMLKWFALALACPELLQNFAIDGSMDIATFNLSSYQQHQSNGNAREALLNRLSMIMCNLDVKSVYVCFDSDKMATNMVNQVIAKVAHCSSVAVTLIRYTKK